MAVFFETMGFPTSCEECKMCIYGTDGTTFYCLDQLRKIDRDENEDKPSWCGIISPKNVYVCSKETCATYVLVVKSKDTNGVKFCPNCGKRMVLKNGN